MARALSSALGRACLEYRVSREGEGKGHVFFWLSVVLELAVLQQRGVLGLQNRVTAEGCETTFWLKKRNEPFFKFPV